MSKPHRVEYSGQRRQALHRHYCEERAGSWGDGRAVPRATDVTHKGAVKDVVLHDSGDGHYNAECEVTCDGVHTVTAMLRNQSLSGSPFRFHSALVIYLCSIYNRCNVPKIREIPIHFPNAKTNFNPNLFQHNNSIPGLIGAMPIIQA